MMIEFKFTGEKQYRQLQLSGSQTRVSATHIKAGICKQMGLRQDIDVEIEDEEGDEIEPNQVWENAEHIRVICKRVPRKRASAEDESSAKASKKSKRSVNDELLRNEEDNAIARMMNQQRQMESAMLANNAAAQVSSEATAQGGQVGRYSRSYRQAVKQYEKKEAVNRQRDKQGSMEGAASCTLGGGLQAAANGGDEEKEPEKKKPPPDYVCQRCGHTDHFHYDCPTNDDPDHVRKVRTAKGIPHFMLKKVKNVDEAQAQALGGVTLMIPGNTSHYVFDHNPDKQEHKDRVGDTIQDKMVIAHGGGAKYAEDSLKCPLCRGLLKEAMCAPCCGGSFCNECAIRELCHGSNPNKCPQCKKDLMAHQLVNNSSLRKQVEVVVNASTGKQKKEEEINEKNKTNSKLPTYTFKKGKLEPKDNIASTEIETVNLSRPPSQRMGAPSMSSPPLPDMMMNAPASSSSAQPSWSNPVHLHSQVQAAESSGPKLVPLYSSESGMLIQQPAHARPAERPSMPMWQQQGLPPPQQHTHIPKRAPADIQQFPARPPEPWRHDSDRMIGLGQIPGKIPVDVPPSQPEKKNMLSKEDFEKLKEAWVAYHAQQDRKEQRRMRREAKQKRRRKRLEKVEKQMKELEARLEAEGIEEDEEEVDEYEPSDDDVVTIDSD